MKYNTDSKFVGLEKLKKKHAEQITEFELWATQENWMRFHHSHYDWWVFPINRGSSYGLMWTVYEGEVAELKKDETFIEKYLKGVQLVSASWGWDVYQKNFVSNPKHGQAWHQWPIRLHKAARSVKLFGYEELFGSLKIYALNLIERGESMIYNGKDLSNLFTH